MNGEALLPEFDREIENTRKMLALTPDECLDYRPHEKSWTLRQLAAHIANIPTWTGLTFRTDTLDMAQPFEPFVPENTEEILAAFDKAAPEARLALENASAETFLEPWTLTAGERVHFTLPKGDVFRRFVLNHLIHHRAQLGLYLRMCDVAIPGMYGPSADDKAS